MSTIVIAFNPKSWVFTYRRAGFRVLGCDTIHTGFRLRGLRFGIKVWGVQCGVWGLQAPLIT